jgi:hypothetical protein
MRCKGIEIMTNETMSMHEIADALAERIFQEYVKPIALHAKPFAEMRQWIYDTLKVAGGLVPEGFVLALKEPTREMIIAGQNERKDGGGELMVYEAMIKASASCPLKTEQEVAQKARKAALEEAIASTIVRSEYFRKEYEGSDNYWQGVNDALYAKVKSIRKLIGEGVG